ncbi:MAG: PKD domain-containing protein, partial [Chitinophagales bacterium]
MTKKLLLSCLLTALCFAFGTQETKAQCQANFTMFVDSGLVFFTDQSGSFIDPVVAWQWDFGMGASSTEQNPVLTLPAGVYSPCLTITTASGCTAIACDTLFISGGGGPIVDSCMIAANFDMIQMGGAIDFQNTSSGNFTLWTWDFGDGNTSTAFSPSHQYNILGLFTVCLTIANDECTETYCMEVDASGLGGSCNVFISSNIDTLATVPVTGMFEAVATGGIAPYAYAWNIGGLAIGDFASTVSYTFDLPGVYDVCVEMTDAEGCVATDCTVIIVEEDPIGWDCQSNFTYGEVPGALGMLFTSISTGSGINSFFWDFGDGNTSTVQDPVHAFNTIGTFTVCLTVTATDGCVSTSCQNVVIGDGPLCTSNFNVTITDLSMSCFNMSTPLMGSEFVWSFGNGDISTEMNPTYNYDAAGTYDVCLTVLTNTAIDSCFAQTCQTVTVIDGGIDGNAILGEISLGDETMPIQFDATV